MLSSWYVSAFALVACLLTLPDIGQGLNTSLEDVPVFVDSLADEKQVRDAVLEYERRRSDEIDALLRIVKFAFPYRYRQNIPMFNLTMAKPASPRAAFEAAKASVPSLAGFAGARR